MPGLYSQNLAGGNVANSSPAIYWRRVQGQHGLINSFVRPIETSIRLLRAPEKLISLFLFLSENLRRVVYVIVNKSSFESFMFWDFILTIFL